jgi:archaemetzincin
MSFRPPSKEEVWQAIGPLDGLPEDFRQAFLPNGDFEPIPVPGPNDWLAVHDEPGQTFLDFVKSRPNRPDARRNTIYLQPLDDFRKSNAPPIDKLVQFSEAFFAMNVEVLPLLVTSSQRITTRLKSLHSSRTAPYTGHSPPAIRELARERFLRCRDNHA